MNKIKLLLAIISLAFGSHYIFAQKSYENEIDYLLSKMTLDEKIGQLIQYTSRWEMTGPTPSDEGMQKQMDMIKKGMAGSMLNITGAEETRKAQELAVNNSRLGIPLIFGYDVVHGFQTMFPIPLGMAASWEPEMIELAARVMAQESTASGLHWTFAPMVDISRDARWGRVMETTGEDPHLGSQLAYAAVKGFQGDDLSDKTTIAACAKHFAAYGFSEAGRDYNTVDISDQTLRNFVLPPFKACKDAGVATFMNAFNIVNGIPSTANKYLVKDILKGEWEFEGFVVSDWNSIGEMINHGTAANKKDAAVQAIQAGSDMDMESYCYIDHLADLVQSGEVDEELIDEAVRRILLVKFKLGLFDDPFKYCNSETEKMMLGSVENMKASYEVAKKSIVLLKNENNTLPLKKNAKIAIIGSLAADKDSPLGNWRAKAIEGSAISLVEGIYNKTDNKNLIDYAEGYKLVIGETSFTKELKFETTDKSGFPQALDAAKQADVVVVAMGEQCFQTGEGRSQTDIKLKGLQEELLDKIVKVNPNVVVVLSNGRPLDISSLAAKVPSILVTWHLGSQSGNAIADVLYGNYNPSGKLPISFPRKIGQVPIYYNHFNTGRPTTTERDAGSVFWSHYTDELNSPLFPFGYGLSYTSFEYSKLNLNKKELKLGEKLQIDVTVANTGEMDGEEVVQLYIQDLFGSTVRPIKELKGFKKIKLAKGHSTIVSFTITDEELGFWTRNNKFEVEPGDFKVFVGTNSNDLLMDKFKILK